MSAALLTLTDAGLYCEAGGFHIDPLRPVPRAVVTHGHADHARPGHDAVLATAATLEIMQLRYGAGCFGTGQPLAYGEALTIGGVTLTLCPAGHILGSAQVVIAAGGTRAVVSGDYKARPDPTCASFEPVPCDIFVTEATFGLPVFRHPPPVDEIGKLIRSVAQFPERTHLVGAYALGKAQRVIRLLRDSGYDAPIHLHGAMVGLTDLYQRHGIALGDLRPLPAADRKAAAQGGIVLCPPAAATDRWARRFIEPVVAFASGWMGVRARARQRGVELPLIISDHVDWTELTESVAATGCSTLWVTHGQEDGLVHWATQRGLAARPLHLLGYGEGGEVDAAPVAEPVP